MAVPVVGVWMARTALAGSIRARPVAPVLTAVMAVMAVMAAPAVVSQASVVIPAVVARAVLVAPVAPALTVWQVFWKVRMAPMAVPVV